MNDLGLGWPAVYVIKIGAISTAFSALKAPYNNLTPTKIIINGNVECTLGGAGSPLEAPTSPPATLQDPREAHQSSLSARWPNEHKKLGDQISKFKQGARFCQLAHSA